MKIEPSEREIQKTILEWLAYYKILAWRNQSGIIIIGDKKKRAIKMGMKGVSDIVGCLPDGKILCIEVKTRKAKVSEVQQEFIDKINKLKGIAFVARNINDIERQLKNYV